MRVFANLDTLELENSAALPPSTTSGVGSRQGLRGRLYSQFRLELGFHRQATGDALIDLGVDPGIEWLLKRSTGTQKYDEAVIASAVTFTREAEGDDFIYSGSMALGAPVMEKLLGVDVAAQQEIVEVEAVADVAGSLNNKYFDVFYGSGATEFYRPWFNVGAAGSAPAAGGGTLVEVAISTNATGSAIATAIAALGAIMVHFSFGTAGDVLTITNGAAVRCGYHHPRSSGFTITTTQAGMAGGATTDEESVTLLGEVSVEIDGERQILELFEFVVENTLRRPSVPYPGEATGIVRVAPIATKTDDYTATAADHTLLFSIATAKTLTLPPVAAHVGRIYMVKSKGASLDMLTIEPDGSELIEGAANWPVAPEEGVLIQADETGWHVLAEYLP